MMSTYIVDVLVRKIVEIDEDLLGEKDSVEEILRDYVHETIVYRDEVLSFGFRKQTPPSVPHYSKMKGILKDD
jgi:hypothetical protein